MTVIGIAAERERIEFLCGVNCPRGGSTNGAVIGTVCPNMSMEGCGAKHASPLGSVRFFADSYVGR